MMAQQVENGRSIYVTVDNGKKVEGKFELRQLRKAMLDLNLQNDTISQPFVGGVRLRPLIICTLQ